VDYASVGFTLDFETLQIVAVEWRTELCGFFSQGLDSITRSGDGQTMCFERKLTGVLISIRLWLWVCFSRDALKQYQEADTTHRDTGGAFGCLHHSIQQQLRKLAKN
jgi:hypothetical protein